jgi:hypothetical protein
MGNEILVPAVTVTIVPSGVIDLAPPFIQPVVVTGKVEIVQPVTVTGTVSLASGPTIDIGVVDQGAPGVQPWPVSGSFVFAPSTTATTTAEAISTSPVLLLGTNLNRKGFAVQATDSVIYVKLDSTVSIALYSYELPRKGILEIENYCGPVAAVTASGSTIAMVTEKV